VYGLPARTKANRQHSTGKECVIADALLTDRATQRGLVRLDGAQGLSPGTRRVAFADRWRVPPSQLIPGSPMLRAAALFVLLMISCGPAAAQDCDGTKQPLAYGVMSGRQLSLMTDVELNLYLAGQVDAALASAAYAGSDQCIRYVHDCIVGRHTG